MLAVTRVVLGFSAVCLGGFGEKLQIVHIRVDLLGRLKLDVEAELPSAKGRRNTPVMSS